MLKKLHPILVKPSHNKPYPPFSKNDLESYIVNRFIDENQHENFKNVCFIPMYWTALQNHGRFHQLGNTETGREYLKMLEIQEPSIHYFIVCQYADGVKFKLRNDINYTIFCGSKEQLPLPLIYDDGGYFNSLEKKTFHNKKYLCSYIGSSTHHIRSNVIKLLKDKPNMFFENKKWKNDVNTDECDKFINYALNSKFSLAPRGYGRSSFRFFEALKMHSIPIYIYDDKIWLPYLDEIDYNKFAIIIHESKMNELYDIMNNINETQYNNMLNEYEKVKNYFELDGFYNYLLRKMKEKDSELNI